MPPGCVARRDDTRTVIAGYPWFGDWGRDTMVALPGLTLTGGVFFTGNFMNDQANTDQLPSVTTYDIGARYQTTATGRPLTLRFNISNLTNKRYWLAYGYLGDPRYFTASAELKF